MHTCILIHTCIVRLYSNLTVVAPTARIRNHSLETNSNKLTHSADYTTTIITTTQRCETLSSGDVSAELKQQTATFYQFLLIYCQYLPAINMPLKCHMHKLIDIHQREEYANMNFLPSMLWPEILYTEKITMMITMQPKCTGHTWPNHLKTVACRG